MKLKLIKKICLGSIIFSFLFLSCSNEQIDICNPLFAISVPEFKDSSSDNRCKLGGVYFDFYNKAECSVAYLEVRMNVYDGNTGKIAFTGQGTLIEDQIIWIKSGEKKNVCIPLDKYITVIPKEGYFIDQFYVSWIEYEDGRYWSDEYGVYAVSGKGQ